MIILMGGREKEVPEKLGLALIKMGKAQAKEAEPEPIPAVEKPLKKKAQKSAVIEDSSDE